MSADRNTTGITQHQQREVEPQTVVVKTGGKGGGCMIAATIGGMACLIVVVGCFFIAKNFLYTGNDVIDKAYGTMFKVIEDNSEKLVDELIRENEWQRRQGMQHGPDPGAHSDEAESLENALNNHEDALRAADAVKLMVPGGQEDALQKIQEEQLEELQDEYEKTLEEMRVEQEKELQNAPAIMKETLEEAFRIQLQTLEDAHKTQVDMLKNMHDSQHDLLK